MDVQQICPIVIVNNVWCMCFYLCWDIVQGENNNSFSSLECLHSTNIRKSGIHLKKVEHFAAKEPYIFLRGTNIGHKSIRENIKIMVSVSLQCIDLLKKSRLRHSYASYFETQHPSTSPNAKEFLTCILRLLLQSRLLMIVKLLPLSVLVKVRSGYRVCIAV